jgi:predicted metal-dependent hydrolase
MKFKKYSDKDLLKQLKGLPVQIERTPTDNGANTAGIESSNHYSIRLDNLNEAQKEALLVLLKNKGVRRKYSNEFLLDNLKQLAEKLGRTPNATDIKEQGNVCAEVYTKRFGSLGKAQKAAGLVPNKRGATKKYTDEYLLNYLKELAVKLGRAPYIKDIIKAGEVSCFSYVSHFGLFSNAVKAAGLVPNKTGFQQKYTNEYLLNYLKELAQKLGRTPNTKDLNKPGVICSAVYAAYFGSINKAVIAAGLVPNKKGNHHKHTAKQSYG